MSTNTLDSEPEFTISASAAETASQPPNRAPSSRLTMVAGVVVTLIAAAVCYLWWTRDVAVPPQRAIVPELPSSAAAPASEPTIQHPIEQIARSKDLATGTQFPLPGLDHSDAVVKDAIQAILEGDAFMQLLVPDAIIRNIVATVDNLPRKAIAQRILPIASVPGPFLTVRMDRGLSISGDNLGRYRLYVQAAEAIDTARLAGFYVRLYPLFQQAYVDLGYPHEYFNDRLVGVIDHLLAAPEPRVPIELSQPRIMFEFADPELEQLSAGQKMLVRVGIENELRLKAKLREIRKAVTVEPIGR